MRGEIQMPQNEPGIDEEFISEFTIHTQREDVRNRREQPVDAQSKKDHNTYNSEIWTIFPLAEKLVAGPIEFDSRLNIPADALALKMINEGSRHLKDLQAGFFHLICPVCFFKEEKVALVKHAYILDGLFAHQEAGADARINLDRFVMIVTLAWITIR